LDEPGELRLVFGRVDVGVLVVVEQAEVAVQTHVDAGRLHHRGVMRVEPDAAGCEFCSDVAVAETHVIILLRKRARDRASHGTTPLSTGFADASTEPMIVACGHY